MKTEICVRFCYGAYEIFFKKDFDFPFTPFYGLYMIEEDEGMENVIELTTNNYQTTTICYYSGGNFSIIKLHVEVRHVWGNPVRDDVVDDIIKTFTWFQWTRTDTTDLSVLKELMNRNN